MAESTSNFHITDQTQGQLVSMACLLEVTIPKPGNVHRGTDFADATLYDFVLSAAAIAPVFDLARRRPLGQTVLNACRATRRVVDTNTNLGIVLLLAPLAKAGEFTTSALGSCIVDCNAEDCQDVYEAIRLCRPGGLGQAGQFDVEHDVPKDLLVAMKAAADRDMIARQYANGFLELLTTVVPNLESAVGRGLSLVEAVIETHVKTMAEFPDSLIRRKNDRATAETSAALASRVIASGTPGSREYIDALAELDFWLRSDGNSRNPGTTADLVTAAIFVCLCKQSIPLPFDFQ